MSDKDPSGLSRVIAFAGTWASPAAAILSVVGVLLFVAAPVEQRTSFTPEAAFLRSMAAGSGWLTASFITSTLFAAAAATTGAATGLTLRIALDSPRAAATSLLAVAGYGVVALQNVFDMVVLRRAALEFSRSGIVPDSLFRIDPDARIQLALIGAWAITTVVLALRVIGFGRLTASFGVTVGLGAGALLLLSFANPAPPSTVGLIVAFAIVIPAWFLGLGSFLRRTTLGTSTVQTDDAG